MKNLLRSLSVTLSFTVAVSSFAQKDNVGIGTSRPDQSAVLDLSSSNKGLLMPRMSLQQRAAIQSPAVGLVVYQTDFLSGFYYYNGKDWNPVSSEGQNSVAGTDGDWSLIGNDLTSTPTAFIGTTSNNPLVFKMAGQKSGYIDNTTGSTFFGYLAGNVNTGANNLGFGSTAMALNQGGLGNIAIGSSALYSNVSGTYNVAIGYTALYNNIAGSNTGIGFAALNTNTAGTGNVAYGYQSLYSNNIGNYNTAVGSNSLYSNTGNNNLGIGFASLYLNNSGIDNIGIGYQAGYSNNGSSNTFIGKNSGYSNIGSGSVFIGKDAGYNETGSSKLYIANSNTATPLIKDDFVNNNLKFHLGTTAPTPTTGYLAIGDFVTAAGTTGGAGGLGIPAMATAGDKYRLIVQDGILTEKLKVALRNSTDWADYVFDKSYKLMSLEKVEAFIKTNKHLPNVPSAEEMAATGIDMQKTSTKFMEKIEELTLYMIEMNKEIKALKVENEKLKKK